MPTKKTDKNSDEENQVFDVAKPGTTAADPTSRPVIVGHKSTLKKDPMIQAEEAKDEPISSAPKSKLKITPLSEKEDIIPAKEDATDAPATQEAEEQKAGSDEQPSEEPAEATPSAESTEKAEETPEEEKKEEPEKEEKKPSEPSSSESEAIDALANEANSKAKEKEAEKALEARNEKMNSLINNKMYNLPIVEGGRAKSWERIITWILLILLLASIGAWIAVDAGYLDIGLELPYDFINN